MGRWLRGGLVLASLLSTGCSFLWTELRKPSFQISLDAREYAPGEVVRASVTLVPQPDVSYRVALVGQDGQIEAQAPVHGTETVVLPVLASGLYDAQLQADGRMIAHLGMRVIAPVTGLGSVPKQAAR